MPLDHDTATTINLIGTTERLVEVDVGTASAVAHLCAIAGSRTDLLEQAARHYLALDTARSAACSRLLTEALSTRNDAALSARRFP
ncbi:MAG: hypothetical protein ACJ72L_12515 [Marmoricola sp.]